ncbi:hypothetical protein C1A40_14005 [Tamlana carrageenivorans]|uniref:Uncharacterized protein n=1 Tax=Pseudotamlana carrageenivorans TaxID=2069432 RepID=A0A2I7SN71_9FLAO|nr:hypothetical protein C1A40_14005 [Tamlana carrageenivorans]
MPVNLRKQKLFAYIKALLLPVNDLYDLWANNRSDNIYKLKHNGQVCYLRKSLNDEFDTTLRRIYIGNGNKYTRQYIYTRAEQKPKFLGKVYLRSRTDYADTGLDFIVYVPTNIVDTRLYELEAWIDSYKEGVKRYKIEKI